MGALTSRIARRINRFNVENRAHRVIADSRPRPAPKYEQTVKEVENLRKEMPSLEEDLLKFDSTLHERLKQVYITSTDVTPRQQVSKELPPLSHQVRRTVDFGFDDEERAPPGRILLKDCVLMLMTYGQDDKTSIDDLAKKYNLQLDDARNIVKYFQCFRLAAPKSRVDIQKYFNKLLIGQSDGSIVSPEEFFEKIKVLEEDSKRLSLEESSKSNQANLPDLSGQTKVEESSGKK